MATYSNDDRQVGPGGQQIRRCCSYPNIGLPCFLSYITWSLLSNIRGQIPRWNMLCLSYGTEYSFCCRMHAKGNWTFSGRDIWEYNFFHEISRIWTLHRVRLSAATFCTGSPCNCYCGFAKPLLRSRCVVRQSKHSAEETQRKHHLYYFRSWFRKRARKGCARKILRMSYSAVSFWFLSSACKKR